MTTKISMDKKYKTRQSGYEVRVLATDLPGSYPVAVAVVGLYNTPLLYMNAEGQVKNYTDDSLDLVEVKPEVTRYILSSVDSGYPTVEKAISAKNNPYLYRDNYSVLKVTFTPGEDQV